MHVALNTLGAAKEADLKAVFDRALLSTQTRHKTWAQYCRIPGTQASVDGCGYREPKTALIEQPSMDYAEAAVPSAKGYVVHRELPLTIQCHF